MTASPNLPVPTSDLSADSLPAPGAPVGRRGLLAGAGLAALVGASALAGSTPAAAQAPKGPQAGARTQSTPVTTTIASARRNGYVYRTLALFDFTPESSSAERRWSFAGVYATADTTLWASLEIPAGATVRDIEWYAYNESGANAVAMARIWRAGTATLYDTVQDVTIPSGGGIAKAVRSAVPSTSNGPFPTATRLMLGYPVRSTATVCLNGVRVGLSGGGQLGLLPGPVRAYDSRVTGGKLASGETRVITLPSSACPSGSVGAQLNVTAVSGVSGGSLRVFPGYAPLPTSSTLNFAKSTAIANGVTVGVSTGRQIKIYATKSVHVVVDVTASIG